MSKTVVILGAKGRFGRNAVEAFHNAGWHVIATGRKLNESMFPHGTEIRHCDLTDRDSTIAACVDADVIIHAAHPLYTEWEKFTSTYTSNVIAAARHCQATIMIPGNVYNYGAAMPDVLKEETPQRPTSRKGRIRVEMEKTFAKEAKNGVQTIILRAGDFFEGVDTGTWFESLMVNKLDKGVLTYPGDMDAIHAWAFLPDMARAMVGLAEQRDSLGHFEEFGFEGYALTGHDLKALVEKSIGRTVKAKSMPWGIMRLIAPFKPLIGEVLEMKYLWTTPHRIDGLKLRKALPDFQPTPVEQAIKIGISG